MNWFQSMTAAQKPPRNINNNKQRKTRTNGGEKLMRTRTEVYFWVFFIVRRAGPGRHGYGWRGGPPESHQTNFFSASCRPWAEAAWQPCGNTGESQRTKMNDVFSSTTTLVVLKTFMLLQGLKQCFPNIFATKYQKSIKSLSQNLFFYVCHIPLNPPLEYLKFILWKLGAHFTKHLIWFNHCLSVQSVQ